MKRWCKRIGVTGMALAAFLVSGIVFAAWVVSGSGSGYAKAQSSQALTTSDASASTTAQLYPGGSGDVLVTVNNPNPFDVKISRIAGDGAVDSDKAGCTDVGGDASKATGVSFTAQDLASDNVVPANGSRTLTLADAASMSNQSVNACQGAIFTIPVRFTAGS